MRANVAEYSSSSAYRRLLLRCSTRLGTYGFRGGKGSAIAVSATHFRKGALRQPNRDLGTALRYHNYAAFVRRLADRTQVETARARLHTLADQLDQLAESVHRPK